MLEPTSDYDEPVVYRPSLSLGDDDDQPVYRPALGDDDDDDVVYRSVVYRSLSAQDV